MEVDFDVRCSQMTGFGSRIQVSGDITNLSATKDCAFPRGIQAMHNTVEIFDKMLECMRKWR